MKIINIFICVVFILFSTILVGCFSTIDYEWTIGEKGINTVCDVVNTFVIDDDRILTAPLCFVFLLPFMAAFVVRSVKRFPENKLKAVSYWVTVGFSIAYWYWMFFGRFIACPLVTY